MSDSAGDWEGTPSSRRRVPTAVLVLLGILLVVAVGVGARRDRPTPTLAVDPAGQSSPDGPRLPSPSSSFSPSARPTLADVWQNLPAAPVGIPGIHRGVWTGRELVVFGSAETAAYDPETFQWRSLPPPPSVPEDASVVWTGTEIVLWGGSSGSGGLGQEPRDGAGLDPSTGEWRQMSEGPLSCTSPAGTWTGREIVYWGAPCRTEDGTYTTAAAAYDPQTDRWRITRPAARAPASVRTLWTGSEVVAWGEGGADAEPAPGFTVAYDPVADAWRELPPPPLALPSEAVGVWTGDMLVLWGSHGIDDIRASTQTGALLDPESATWWAMGGAPTPSAADRDPYGFRAVWTGELMLMAGGYPAPVDLSYDPTGNLFTELPHTSGARVNPVVVWTGDQLLVWGGYTTHGPDVDLVGWTPTGPEAREADG